jgi:hypothetical protein
MLIVGGSDLTTGVPGLPGVIVTAIVAGGAFIVDRFVMHRPIAL